MIKKIIIGNLILLLLSSGWIFSDKGQGKVDAKSSATSLALVKHVPDDLFLTIEGKGVTRYFLDGKELKRLATTRIRTREVNKSNEILGAYICYGIPLYSILEGIAPHKSPALR